MSRVFTEFTEASICSMALDYKLLVLVPVLAVHPVRDSSPVSNPNNTVKPSVLPPPQISHIIDHEKLGFSRVSRLGLELGLVLALFSMVQSLRRPLAVWLIWDSGNSQFYLTVLTLTTDMWHKGCMALAQHGAKAAGSQYLESWFHVKIKLF